MGNKRVLTTVLGVLGVFLTLAPVLAGIVASIRLGTTALWYVPAAGGPLVLIGGGLLVWASVRANAARKAVAWPYGAAVALWVAAAIAAPVTGLASGRVQEGGWESTLVTGLYAAYVLATVALGVAGSILVRDVRAEKLGEAPPADGTVLPSH
jgi:hypothetical protein